MGELRPDQIEEALRWFVLLRDTAATDADRRRFAAWLAQNPAHRAAWRRAEQVWARADLIGPAFHRDVALQSSGRRRWLQAAAAAAAIAVGGGYSAWPWLRADYRTAAAERRSITLPDGSAVELGSASALSLAFDAGLRRVVLLEGEAFFTVAAEAARPFVVEAAQGRSRALGTAFDVKRSGETVSVTVAEHDVAVAVGGAEVTLGAGEQLRYGADGIDGPGPADLATALAWRHDRLVFRDAPLGAVIAELERYRSGRVVVTDDRLAAMPVTAVFDTRQTDAALQTIADTLPVRLLRATDLIVFLYPAD